MCMVVGTVIGSGIFFRNEAIIGYTGGRMWIGVAAWLIGGFITLSATYVFGVLATRHERVGGLVDYGEALLGERYGYFFGWFMATMFLPGLSGILAWISARFTVVLFGWETDSFFSGQTYSIALFYLVMTYAVNSLAQKLSGKVQVSATFIKIVPLLAMGIIGTIVGLANGTAVANLHSDYVGNVVANPFLSALVATVFAYVGWEGVLALNSEIKDSKRNLPIALVGGLIVIMTIYTLYFVGIFSAAPVEVLSDGAGVRGAFVNVFSEAGGTALFVFIVISCLGTLNGLVMSGQRSFYALSIRGCGVKPGLISQVDKTTNVPNNSASLFLFVTACWMLVFAGNRAGWFGELVPGQPLPFDVPGLMPILFQGFLIPLFIMIMVKEKTLGAFNRFIAPVIAMAGAIFLIYAAISTQGMRFVWFFLIFLAIMFIGALFYKGSAK